MFECKETFFIIFIASANFEKATVIKFLRQDTMVFLTGKRC
jgi:hypothetical protein